MIISNPCDVCGSKDNLKTHDNGSVWCYTPECAGNKNRKQPKKEEIGLVPGVFSAIPARRISQRTCEFFNYQVGVDKGEAVQIANYNGCQQIRTKDKRFYFVGDTKQLTFWGKDKWSNAAATLVITEGQIDAMSIGEAQDCKWPVVSLPNGTGSAKKTCEAEMDWLLGFKNIILCFDNDESGKTAVAACVGLFPPGKIKIASLSEKDANECLKKGKFDELAKIVFNAQEYRPDGIVSGEDISVEELFTQEPKGISLPYPVLNEMIRGLKTHRIYTVLAGTGNGKSTFLKEVVYHVRKTQPDIKIANIFLEEAQKFTALSYIAMDNNLPTYRILEDINLLSEEQKEKSLEILKPMFFYKHFGSLESKRLFNLLDYLVIGKGVQFIILDHISILVSGLTSSGEGERRDIDVLMTNLRSFSERTGATILVATQLKRKKNSYSLGEEIVEADSRGSGSLEHLSDIMISLNVNRKNESPNDCQLKVLKNRLTGMVGNADLLSYDTDTGRLLLKNIGERVREQGDEHNERMY